MNENFYAQTQPPVRYQYSAAQKWLLFAAIIIALAFDRSIFAYQDAIKTINQFTGRYFIFWGSYLISLYIISWKQLSKNADAWFLLASVLLLFSRALIYTERNLAFVNLIVIPLLLMLHAVVAHFRFPKGSEGQYMLKYIKGWLIWPFCAIGRFFGSLGAVLSKGDSKNRNKIAVGFLLALPLVLLVTALLLSADNVMNYYFGKLFSEFKIGRFVGHLLLIFATAMVFYSFIFNVVWERSPDEKNKQQTAISHVSISVVIGSLLIIYAVFAYVQFAYLFGSGGLPDGLTYSEYARSGFAELLLVAAINIAVFGISLIYSEGSAAVKWLLACLIIMTGIVLASGVVRLSMYIDAYGLTVFRILPMWFMIFLGFTIILCGLKLFWGKLLLIRSCTIALICWYLILNAVNLDAMVASSILKKARAQGSLSETDRVYVMELSKDADKVREEYQDLLAIK